MLLRFHESIAWNIIVVLNAGKCKVFLLRHELLEIQLFTGSFFSLSIESLVSEINRNVGKDNHKIHEINRKNIVELMGNHFCDNAGNITSYDKTDESKA